MLDTARQNNRCQNYSEGTLKNHKHDNTTLLFCCYGLGHIILNY